MLVIKLPNNGCGKLLPYKGNGIFSSLIKKLISGGVKKVINTSTKQAISHKLKEAIVKGAKKATEKAAENTVTNIVNFVTPVLKKGIKGVISKKRKNISPDITPHKKLKLSPQLPENINALIDGAGIILQ